MCYKCPICGGKTDINPSIGTNGLYFYQCENGCRFFAPDLEFDEKTDEISYYDYSYNRNKLKSYLFYHKSDLRPILLSQEDFSKINKKGFVKVYNLTPEMVENWYPKTFAEKIDYILLYLGHLSHYAGEHIKIDFEKTTLTFFMQNYFEHNNNKAWKDEIIFLLSYLKDSGNVRFIGDNNDISDYILNIAIYQRTHITFELSSKGWERVYELQKKQENNKNVFVAMKFGEETKELREKIKEGLAGYSVRIMDEIEHNNQIVPEMLYEIKNSRFVVAELSHHNNGAYYEAGYALGLGKEVIHICSEQELKSGLHFDVAQVNTITYKDINEIPEKLKKRIQATIENK